MRPDDDIADDDNACADDDSNGAMEQPEPVYPPVHVQPVLLHVP